MSWSLMILLKLVFGMSSMCESCVGKRCSDLLLKDPIALGKEIG